MRIRKVPKSTRREDPVHKLTAVLLVIATVVFAPPAVAATADEEFARLAADLRALPRIQVPATWLPALTAAGAAAARRAPCVAINIIGAFRNQVAAATSTGSRLTRGRPLSRETGARLDGDAVAIIAVLLGAPEAARCGGAAEPPADGTHPIVDVVSSTTDQMELRVRFPKARFTTRLGNGRPYIDLAMEGVGEGGAIGEPHVPRLTRLLAIPRGADVSVEVLRSSSYALGGVVLWPLQEEALDQDNFQPPDRSVFADKPFRIDSKIYAADALYPARPAGARALGTMRDLEVGGVEVDGAQYNPRARQLRIYTSLDVRVRFGGDNTGFFGDNRADDVYNLAFGRLYRGSLLNAVLIRDHLVTDFFDFCGDEVLIVTSPALRPAAETLAASRRTAGYDVGVYETGAAPGQVGTTNTEIQSFILSQLTSACRIRPSYVILFGNTAHVPTFLVPCSPGGDVTACDIASDLPYVLATPGDLFADAAYGRIPVVDLPQAEAVVNKITTYQTTPPAPDGDDFYRHATTTAYFQPALHCVLNAGETGTPNCDGNTPPVTGHWEIDYANHQDTRGFTITAETVGNAMRMNGYEVDRLYTTDDVNVIPETYYNGMPIPAHLLRPAFPWNADSVDFLGVYNEGRFLILHRDHGWPDGWAEPTLHSGHVPLMTNGTKLPVVFGINCASAAFDNPAHPSFVELQVTRIGGGAVAGFGDTRNSPSFPNNHITIGFFDSLFPNTVASYGSSTPVVHLGEVLLKGKQYLATQEGIDWQGAGDTYVMHYLYGLLGDPTLRMWIAEPRTLDLEKIRFVLERVFEPRPGDPPYVVTLPPLPEPLLFEGTVTTLLQGGQVIGRGLIHNGTVTIAPETMAGEGPLTIAIEQEGFLPGQAGVEIPNVEPAVRGVPAVSGHRSR
jgi:hypothetical protein